MKSIWISVLVATGLAVAACGQAGTSEPAADCGSVLRFEGRLYWGTVEHARAGRTTGHAEEPTCVDGGASGAGPGRDAVRRDIPVASLEGVDTATALVVPEEGSGQGMVYVQGNAPVEEIPDDVAAAIKSQAPTSR